MCYLKTQPPSNSHVNIIQGHKVIPGAKINCHNNMNEGQNDVDIFLN